MGVNRKLASVAVGLFSTFGLLVVGWAQPVDVATPTPLIAQDQTVKISDHVYVILDNNVGFVPNVGIVVGDRATLVIETGLGLPNGEIVLAETNKISANEELYVVSTHYHSEHDLGAGAFPARAQMIRSRDQQQDLDEFGLSHAERFSRMSAVMTGLLEGADFRQADIYFEDEYSLDLGGVTVHMFAVGPAHTGGDTVFFIEGEGVLFSGDVAMRGYPGFRVPSSSLRVWREALAMLAGLNIDIVVPSHGPTGDAGAIQRYDEYFAMLQARAAELKAQGRSADETAELLTRELPLQFAEWPSEDAGRIGAAARGAFAEAP